MIQKNNKAVIAIIGASAILLSLSAWQVNRLQWKNNIIEKLDNEYTKNPAKYVYDFKALNELGEGTMPIRYGRVKGELMPSHTMLFGPKPHEGKAGFDVVTPLRMNKGYILVHRGWIAEEDGKENKKEGNDSFGQNLNVNSNKVNQTLLNEVSLANINIDGIIRKSEWNHFTPDNSPENEIWSKLDIESIAKAKNLSPIAPVIIYADSSNHKDIISKSSDGKWYPRNKHKYYAIFWFVMACALWGVAGNYWFNNKRKM